MNQNPGKVLIFCTFGVDQNSTYSTLLSYQLNGTVYCRAGGVQKREIPKWQNPPSSQQMRWHCPVSFPLLMEVSMKKHSVLCPVCGINFDPRAPGVHIKKHHSAASRYELILIRDARRLCFGKSKPYKNKSPCLL